MTGMIEISPRDADIIRLIVTERLNDKQIGQRLGMSGPSVTKRLGEVYKKLGLETWGVSRIRMVLWAMKEGGFK